MNIQQEYSFGDIYIRYAVDESPDDKYFAMHVHERCEIFYFVSGNAEYLVEGARYPLKPGSLLIMRPAESHRTRILGSSRYERYALNFSASSVGCIDPEHRLLKAFFHRPLGRGNFYMPDKMKCESVFHDMCCGQDDYEKRLKIQINLFVLLDIINSAYLKTDAAGYAGPQNISEQMVAYVNANLFEEISVPLLAEKFFLSVSQFGRLFKQATGASPWEYITIKRLTAAKEKIRKGALAQHAAQSCGFGDYSAFYRSYVNYFGCSPKSDNG